MKIMISYFYQVRFFNRGIIPLSTAKFDPKWFHNFRGESHQFIDKNGVYNGIKIKDLIPGEACVGLCHGPEGCKESPQTCSFLKAYRAQLDKIDFPKFIRKLQNIASNYTAIREVEEPTIIFLVHETPDNPCSERVIIKEWFRDNGVIVEEFRH